MKAAITLSELCTLGHIRALLLQSNCVESVKKCFKVERKKGSDISLKFFPHVKKRVRKFLWTNITSK